MQLSGTTATDIVPIKLLHADLKRCALVIYGENVRWLRKRKGFNEN